MELKPGQGRWPVDHGHMQWSVLVCVVQPPLLDPVEPACHAKREANEVDHNAGDGAYKHHNMLPLSILKARVSPHHLHKILSIRHKHGPRATGHWATGYWLLESQATGRKSLVTGHELGCATLCYATPLHTKPCHAMRRRAVLNHAVPCRTVLHHAIPYHATPCHTQPHYVRLWAQACTSPACRWQAFAFAAARGSTWLLSCTGC